MSKILRNIKNEMSKKDGFTLVELIVVVVLMGIIAAIAIPTVGNVYGTINKKDCIKNQKMMKLKIEQYKTGDFPYMSSPNKIWTAGSYDPITKKWSGASATEAYSYSTLNADSKYVSVDYFPDGMSEGERFMRYALEAKDSETLEFPHSSADGCQLYINYCAAHTTENPSARSYVEIKCSREDHNPEESYRVYF